jgi:hypothetical protein
MTESDSAEEKEVGTGWEWITSTRRFLYDDPMLGVVGTCVLIRFNFRQIKLVTEFHIWVRTAYRCEMKVVRMSSVPLYNLPLPPTSCMITIVMYREEFITFL